MGFAAGVMTAASYWSLLAPAIEMAEESKLYGPNGEYAFVPVGIGFLLGALFVYGADVLITTLGVHSPNVMLGKRGLIIIRTLVIFVMYVSLLIGTFKLGSFSVCNSLKKFLQDTYWILLFLATGFSRGRFLIISYLEVGWYEADNYFGFSV